MSAVEDVLLYMPPKSAALGASPAGPHNATSAVTRAAATSALLSRERLEGYAARLGMLLTEWRACQSARAAEGRPWRAVFMLARPPRAAVERGPRSSVSASSASTACLRGGKRRGEGNGGAEAHHVAAVNELARTLVEGAVYAIAT